MSTTSSRPPRQVIPSSLLPDSSAAERGLDSQDLSLTQALRVLRKRKRVIYLITLICVVLTLVASLLLRPHYRSIAEIEIEHDQSNALENSLGSTGIAGVPDDAKVEVQTEVTILQSDDLAIETMEKAHFEEHEGVGRKTAEKGLPLSQAPAARKNLLQKFAHQLSVSPQEGTRLIQVGFTDRDPKYAASTVMTLIDLYVQERLRRRNSSTLQATDWIGAQISEMNKKLEASQKALTDYQRESGLVALPAAGSPSLAAGGASGGAAVRSPAVDRLVQLNQNLVAAETDRISKEAIYRVVQSGNPETVANVASSQLANNPSQDPTRAAMFSGLMNLRQQQGNLNVQLTVAKRTYGPKNPHLIDLNKQLDEVNRQIKDEVRAIVNRASLDYQTALKNETGIRQAYEQALKETGEANGKQGHLSVLQQEADSMRALYEDLYTKLEQARLSVGTQASNVALISRALAPAQPAYPKPVLYSLVSIFAGLFLGVIAAFVVESADDSVVTSAEVEDFTGFPVLASVPNVGLRAGSKRSKRDSSTEESLQAANWMVRNPQSASAEAFRLLRMNLLSGEPGRLLGPLLISSPLSFEGRTTTTYNLGCSFATGGKKTLIIDADLRKPGLHLCAGVSNSRGLSTLLSSAENAQGVIVPVPGVANLSLLPAGPAVSNPAELLETARFDELLAYYLSQYEVVLLDSPPFMLVSDAAILSKKADGVLLVACSGSTTGLVLQRVAQQLRRIKANVLGVSLNGVNTSSSEYYYTNGFYGYDGKEYHVNN